MLCPSCQIPNRDDAKFCKNCGHTLHNGPVVVAVENSAGHAQAQAYQQQEASLAQEPSVPVPQASPQDAEEEDPSLAPTQILTPEQMMAMQARRRQLEEQEEQLQVVKSAPGQAQSHRDEPPVSTPESAPPFEADLSRSPTLYAQPPAKSQSNPIPPPPPPESLMSPSASATDETSTSYPDVASTIYPTDMVDVPPDDIQKNDATPAAEGEIASPSEKSREDVEKEPMPVPSAQPSQEFPTLPVGTTVIGRYEITSVVSESPQEHVYQVADHQGYRHCWNCGSEQNTEGSDFCSECGVDLINTPSSIMHEYPATENKDGEAHLLPETLINTFIDQGHTYVVEQLRLTQSAFPNGVHLLGACDSDAGDVRRSDPNEDSTLVLLLQRVHESLSEPTGVFIVADGLGGHDSGQLASRTAINIVAEHLVRELLGRPLTSEKAGETVKARDEATLVGLLQGAVEDANTVLCQMNQRNKTDMGSTLTGFMIVGDYAYIINVGDSRTYMLRAGQIYQLTTDHSLVGQLLASGLIQPDEVYTHPQRSQIFRSLGDKLNVQMDTFKQHLHPGDILLSCSDGLWEMVRDPQIENILATAPNPQTACTRLIETANANGGEDNVSAVVVFVQ